MMTVLFAVEVLEPLISKWMYIELTQASRIVGRSRLWIFNVKRQCEAEMLASIATKVEHVSITSRLEDLQRQFSNIILLDPSAHEPLQPTDFTTKTMVIIGGIMGDHPPRHRTRTQLAEKLGKNYLSRNLGRGQFTIDGAIYVANKISLGTPLEAVRVKEGIVLRKDEVEVYLPYAYPIENDRVVISEEEIKYILEELEDDEARSIRENRLPSLC